MLPASPHGAAARGGGGGAGSPLLSAGGSAVGGAALVSPMHPPPLGASTPQPAWTPPTPVTLPFLGAVPPLSPAAPGALDWVEYKSAEGKPYWYNKSTKKSSWDKPDELKTPEERAKDASPWKEFKNSEGKAYYYNTQTKVTTWDIPAEYKELLERLPPSRPTRPIPTPVTLLPPGPALLPVMTAPVPSPVVPPSPATVGNANAIPLGQKGRLVGGTPVPIQPGPMGMRLPMPIQKEPLAPIKTEFDTKEEAEEAFMNLLKEVGVEASWTWEATMRVVISHPLYRALKTLDERKAAHQKYVAELQRIEQEKEREREEKIKQDFIDALKKLPDITVSTPFSHVVDALGSHPAYLAVPNERERHLIFTQFIQDLRRHERDELRQRQRVLLERFTQVLRAAVPDLSFRTLWRDARAQFEATAEFRELIQSPEITYLDLLIEYENIIKAMEREHKEKEDEEARALYRQDRKNRDAFRQLLSDLQSQGLITPLAKWRDIYPIVKDEPSYINILGQPGSTPLELFWSMVMEQDEEIAGERRIIADVLKKRDFVFTPATTWEELDEVVRQDDQAAQIEERISRIVFEQLKKKALKKAESEVRRADSERRRAERKIRKRAENFRSLLRRLDPPVAPDEPWERALLRVRHRSDFLALDDEAVAEMVFEKFKEDMKPSQRRTDGSSDTDGYADADANFGRRRDSRHGRHPASGGRHERQRRSASLESGEEPDDDDRRAPAKRTAAGSEHRALSRSTSTSAEEGEIGSDEELDVPPPRSRSRSGRSSGSRRRRSSRSRRRSREGR